MNEEMEIPSYQEALKELNSKMNMLPKEISDTFVSYAESLHATHKSILKINVGDSHPTLLYPMQQGKR